MANTKMTYSMALDNALNLGVDVLGKETYDRLVDLKNSLKKKKSGKETEKQKENNAIMALILDILADGSKKTVTEIMVALDNKYSNQKITSLVKKLVDEEEVVRSVESRVAYFSIPTIDEDVE